MHDDLERIACQTRPFALLHICFCSWAHRQPRRQVHVRRESRSYAWFRLLPIFFLIQGLSSPSGNRAACSTQTQSCRGPSPNTPHQQSWNSRPSLSIPQAHHAMPPKQSAPKPRGRPPSKPSGGAGSSGPRRSAGAGSKAAGSGRPKKPTSAPVPADSDDEVPDAPDADEEEEAEEAEEEEQDEDAEERGRPRPRARQGAAAGAGGGGSSRAGGGSKGKGKAAAATVVLDDDEFDDPFADDDFDGVDNDNNNNNNNGEGGEAKEQPRRIPPELLRRLLHEFFDKGGTRISSEANGALARYFDVFVQEAIARTMAERSGRFLGVEDLEKVAPQLLLDL
ncbi:hypothetical protein GGTG_11060 [Gaeumannomyces tritici R3-111a-1]|uniref:Centromere protein X n=1 Tax=Gaeumannomyces tritici (strain R3-111a-1) TaxID=644352 RepID=J3PC37_GAET3|nr:hypothetical protein GGTG_11060 [Gaeumannomyces tritici R3-111a-1]EJT71807.1 hypothetical protein GGTG_11060 [Gaeumannomyces tritici R3-111a-1]